MVINFFNRQQRRILEHMLDKSGLKNSTNNVKDYKKGCIRLCAGVCPYYTIENPWGFPHFYMPKDFGKALYSINDFNPKFARASIKARSLIVVERVFKPYLAYVRKVNSNSKMILNFATGDEIIDLSQYRWRHTLYNDRNKLL